MILSIERSDGNVSILHLLDESKKDSALKKWSGANGEIVSYKEISKSDLPKDRYFRDAWKSDLSVDMDKARDIHMENIRIKRDERLKELDIETLRGNDVQAKKQKIRDIPSTFDLTKADTPEKLKKLWPKELSNV